MNSGPQAEIIPLPHPQEVGWISYAFIGNTTTLIDMNDGMVKPGIMVTPHGIFYHPKREQWADANVSWFIQQKLKVIHALRDKGWELVDSGDKDAAFGFLSTAVVSALEVLEVAIKKCWLTWSGGVVDPPKSHKWAKLYGEIPAVARRKMEEEYRKGLDYDGQPIFADRYQSISAALPRLEKEYTRWRYWFDNREKTKEAAIDIDHVMYLAIVLLGSVGWDDLDYNRLNNARWWWWTAGVA